VPHPAEAAALRFSGSALLPGLINAHTHLELTGLRGRLQEPDFAEWIQAVRRAKEALAEETFLEWAIEGVKEAWRYGVTTVADTGTSDGVLRALTQLGGAGIVYREAIHPDPSRAQAEMARLEEAIERWQAEAGPRVRVGISPHAPYTVSRALYRRAAAYARSLGLPLAGHVAESQAETLFVVKAQGPFAERWRQRGLELEPPAPSPVRLLEDLGVLGPDFLAIHAVQVDGTDVDALRRAGSAVVTCPRSNRRHGHGAAPLRGYLEAGVRLALGTDSVASVEDLDLWAEAREARLTAGLSAEAALQLMTIEGARALGQEVDIGSLEAGKWADLVVVRLPGPVPHRNDLIAEALLLSRPQDIVATFVSGRVVYASHPGGVESP
jgi:5-methylthioadenosine/S-adenosylhomocysteine deaminase